MELRQLKTLVAIEDCGSFAGAADAVGLTQSAVSLQIRHLEEELGAELFDRTRRSPRFNAKGRALAAHARKVVEICAHITAHGASDALEGTLLLGAVPTSLDGIVPPALAFLREYHPGLLVRVTSGLSADLTERLRSGAINTAVVTEPHRPADGLTAHPIAREPLVVLAPPDAAGDSDQEILEAAPFIQFDRRAWVGQRIDRHLRDRGIRVSLGMEINTLEAIARMVRWRLVFSFVATAIVGRLLIQLRRLRGKHDELGRVTPGGPEALVAALLPWIVLAVLSLYDYLIPALSEGTVRLPPVAIVLVAVAIAVVQLGRRTARRVAAGTLEKRVGSGFLRRSRTLWRRLCRRVFGLDLPRAQVEALATIDFRAERGMVGILGPNGAGKTTLLRLVAGILEPSLGTVQLGGVLIKRIQRHLARWVGYLPQDFGLPKDLTGREYLEYFALLYDIGTPGERTERVEHLLEEVGLGEHADRKIGGYSGGMRQRVAVARTLLRLPPIIIVDEPTVGLDPRERIRFRNLLVRLAKTRVVLFSTHVVADVALACERVIVLARGEIVFDGEPSRLARRAEGKVWEVRLDPGEEDSLPDGALMVDQVPEGDGRSRARVLCATLPLPGARADAPTLEDGYLQLVGSRAQSRLTTEERQAESDA